MASQLKLELTVDDKGSVVVKQFGQNAEQAFKQTSTAGTESTGMLDSLKANWIVVSAAVVAAGVAMSKAMEYMTQGAMAQQAADSFKAVAAAAGESSSNILEAMKKASAGTVDDSDIMQKAVKGMIMGLSGDQMVQIMEGARVAARLTGTDVTSAYASISDALANDMPRSLRQFGLISKQEMNVFSEAIAQGIDSVNLADFAIISMQLQAAKLGGVAVNSAEQLQIFKAQAKETGETIGGALLWAVQKVYAVFQGLAAGVLFTAAAFPMLLKYMDLASAKFFEFTGQGDRAKAYLKDAEDMGKAADDLMGASADLTAKATANLQGKGEASAKVSAEEIARLEAEKQAILAKAMAAIGAVDRQKLAVESLKAVNKAYFTDQEANLKYIAEVAKLTHQNELDTEAQSIAARETINSEFYTRSIAEFQAEADARSKTDKLKVSSATIVAEKTKALDAEMVNRGNDIERQKQVLSLKTAEFLLTTNAAMYQAINQYSDESTASQILLLQNKAKEMTIAGQNEVLVEQYVADATRKIYAEKDKAALAYYQNTMIYGQNADDLIERLADDEYTRVLNATKNEEAAEKAKTNFIVDQNLKRAESSKSFFTGMAAQWEYDRQHMTTWG